MKTIYISGKNGFIGSHLKDSLNDTYNILPGEWNLENVTGIKMYEPEIIIHCAARVGSINCQQDYIDAYNSNVLGTFRIAMLAKELGSYFVYVSSIDVYKFQRPNLNILSENSPLDPKTVYGRTKLEGEKITEELVAQSGLILRLGYIFGKPGEDKYSMISKVLKKEKVYLVDDCGKDYLFIDDCVEAIKTLVDKHVCGVMNIGSGNQYLVRNILELLGVRDFVFDPMDYTGDFIVNVDKVKSLLKIFPRTDFWEKVVELRREYERKNI